MPDHANIGRDIVWCIAILCAAGLAIKVFLMCWSHDHNERPPNV